MLTLFIIAWLLTGYIIPILELRKEDNIELLQLFLFLYIAPFGPFTYLIFYFQDLIVLRKIKDGKTK